VVDAPRLPSSLEERDAAGLVSGEDVEGCLLTGGPTPPELEDLTISGCHLRGVRLTGSVLRHVELVDCVLDDCELSGTTLESVIERRVVFRRCRFSGSAAPGLRASHVSLHDCQMDGAWLRMAILDHCHLEDCDLRDGDLYEATLRSSALLRCRLDGCQVSSLTATDVALHGSTVEGVVGVPALQGVSIGPEQILDFALPALHAAGITVTDPDAED
jgi:uncharacterized protein YjbI with pentapeptide repeats